MQQVAICMQAAQSPQPGNQPLCNSTFVQIKQFSQIREIEKTVEVDHGQSSFFNPYKTGSQDEKF